jgi:hypothetical protein
MLSIFPVLSLSPAPALFSLMQSEQSEEPVRVAHRERSSS